MHSIKRIVSLSLLLLMLISSTVILLPVNKTYAQSTSMTFTTGDTIDFSSNTEMSFWSNVSMRFGTGIQVWFIEIFNGNGMLEPCDVIQVVFPPGFVMDQCTWWEVMDPLGNPTGFEFHIDEQYGPSEFHIDYVWPGPFPLPIPGGLNLAEKKIEVIRDCSFFVVHWPSGWYPAPCTWWEIIDPETGQATGYEFHVDWTNESCEFHIDEIIPGPYILPWPWWEIEARRKILEIKPCDWFVVLDPIPSDLKLCTWWEIMYNGQPTGLEFHVDNVVGGAFHVDQVVPDPLKVPPMYPTIARKKVDRIQPCEWFRVDDPLTTPKPCTWWRVIDPDIGDVEFHVDVSFVANGTFHVDEVLPPTAIDPTFQLRAEKKFEGLGPCDWFKVIKPLGYLPSPCSWWKIVSPPEWAGVRFHVDSNDGISKFHIDIADALPPSPDPPPWNVTAEFFNPWFWKPGFADYAPSGMPDFDQRQAGTYMWRDMAQKWSHCGPVSVANSLWWLDSEFEPNPVPPPVINDHYPLVMSYGQWDDHDPLNVPWLVEHLAKLMDTDGRRTLVLVHSGTNVADMEAGLAHYLSWTGVNPPGDVDGNGIVDLNDQILVMNAMGTSPGVIGWNMAADVWPASVTYPPVIDNVIDPNDLNLVLMNMGSVGLFYEHTVYAPDFYYIEEEVERCQDVVLLLGYWYLDPQSGDWFREDAHYVTVAGVNSAEQKIAISDPFEDAFERSLIPEGRVPVPHAHPPLEPPYITHNNASLVSHDIYQATIISPPFPPCPGGTWTLVNYVNWQPTPPFFAVIEAAVITSPFAVHDIAVTNVTSPKTVVCQGFNCSINVTVANQGGFTETFNVTAYADTTAIGKRIMTLTSGSIATITFKWNSSGFTKGNYTISATADRVPCETEIADNTFTDGWVFVSMLGDLTGGTSNVWDFVPDGIVDGSDLIVVSRCFGSYPGAPPPMIWKANCDLTNDGTIDGSDIIIVSKHFGEKDP